MVDKVIIRMKRENRLFMEMEARKKGMSLNQLLQSLIDDLCKREGVNNGVSGHQQR